MHCHEVKENIYAYCDGLLSPTLGAKIAWHINECEICRNIYNLTKAETELLKDTTDIPDIAPDFTAKVLNSIGTAKALTDPPDSQPLNKKHFASFTSRPWYLALGAAAAVIALCLYLPQLFDAGSPVNIAENELFDGQPVLTFADSSTPAPTDQVVPVPAVTQPRASTPAVISPAPQPESSLPAGDKDLPTVSTQPNAALGTRDTAPVKILSAAPTTEEASTSVAASPALVPQNVPDRYHLVAVNTLIGNEMVYNYTSRDEQQTLRISVVPYLDDTELIPPYTRNLKVGDQMITVTFSGNQAPEELELLANTIQFETAALDNHN